MLTISQWRIEIPIPKCLATCYEALLGLNLCLLVPQQLSYHNSIQQLWRSSNWWVVRLVGPRTTQGAGHKGHDWQHSLGPWLVQSNYLRDSRKFSVEGDRSSAGYYHRPCFFALLWFWFLIPALVSGFWVWPCTLALASPPMSQPWQLCGGTELLATSIHLFLIDSKLVVSFPSFLCFEKSPKLLTDVLCCVRRA